MQAPIVSSTGFFGRLIHQFSKFAVVGLLNTAIDFAILNILTLITGITQGGGVFVINTVAFTVATVNSYYFNKHWTFRDQDKKEEKRKFLQFIAISVIGAAINGGVVVLITTSVSPIFASLGLADQWWVNIAKIFATGVSLIWNFVGYKFIVFKK